MPDTSYATRCPHCSTEFQPSPRQTYCSRACKREASRIRRRPLRLPSDCKTCGVVLPPHLDARGAPTLFCCQECRVINFARQRGRGFIDLTAGVVSESVRRTDTASYLANLRTDPCAFCGSHDAIHVDHITPRAEGGTNGWDNYTALCGSCNGRKATRSLLVAQARHTTLRAMQPLLEEYTAWDTGTPIRLTVGGGVSSLA